MLSKLTIPREKSAEPALNQETLYALGLEHAQRLAGRIWTDYNVHDPGVTTLELLCYALTDLAYRASFPVRDLLASATDNAGEMKKQFFTARQILPNRPLTLLDYRKLLIDLKDIKNAWIRPAPLSYYADKITGELFGPATLLEGDIKDLPAFADRLKKNEDPVSQWLNEHLSAETKDTLSAYSGAGEGRQLSLVLMRDINALIHDVAAAEKKESIYEEKRFDGVTLSEPTDLLLKKELAEEAVIRLNRLLLEDAYPAELLENTELRNHVGKPGIIEIEISGLYDVTIDYSDGITKADKAAALSTARELLQRNRNLCEDFVGFSEVETQEFLLCAELELAPAADVEKVHAEIYFQTQQYLAPAVANHTLTEMLIRKHKDGSAFSVDEIFNGPALDCGFIDDDELAAAELRTEVRLSDVISIIMDIEGVRAVREIVINPKGTTAPLENKWIVPVAALKKALLDRRHSRLVCYKRNMPVPANPAKVEQNYTALVAEARSLAETAVTYDLEIPIGRYRDPATYYSFQNHFPAIYGLSEQGLSSAADETRKALALQLKTYLLFFDQIMANYFAQLSCAKDLLATDPGLKRTYFAQVVDSFADYAKIYGGGPLTSLEGALEDAMAFAGRRNRFLDHLISRFAERLTDFANIMHSAFDSNPAALIPLKCEFLQEYPAISSERSLAYNYSRKENADLWNSANVSGLEKRLVKLLGIRNFTRRNLGEIAYDVYVEVDASPGDEFRWRVRHRETGQILLSSSTKYVTPKLAKAEMQTAISLALIPQGYQRKVTPGGKHFFNIVDGTGNVVAQRIEDFATVEAMEAAIASLIEYLHINYSDEGMYLIESILLRPEQAGDPFLPICPDPNCTDCAEADPYSYRIHVILPSYGSRFANMDFRRFVEEVIREETPAHILPRICWIGKDDMAALEKAYRDWIYLRAGAETAERTARLKTFIDILFAVRNVYPQRQLHECDSGEDKPKFLLGQSALGSIKAED